MPHPVTVIFVLRIISSRSARDTARINAQTPRVVAFQKTSQEIVAAYAEDLRDTLNDGRIMQRKAFLNSFIRRINIKDSEAEIAETRFFLWHKLAPRFRSKGVLPHAKLVLSF
ncbi:MAG TPA: hypothetical protein VGI03_03910 [Verrucomicrobiae bacterium]|jgi:hypothetical protein